MANINELPNEVLQKMAQSAGIDTTRVEPEDQSIVKPTESIDDLVGRMTKENGQLGKLNNLIRQRVEYNKLVKRLQDEQVAAELKKQAVANRTALFSTWK